MIRICRSKEKRVEITGVIHNGTVVLDQPATVPDGTRVIVRVPDAREQGTSDQPSTLGKRLLRHAGTVTGLPVDMAEQHDHYLHGTPKR
jgi:hypothetical protein